MGYDKEFKADWDDEKSRLCKEIKDRGYLIEEVARSVLKDTPAYYTHPRYPDQTRAVGRHNNRFFTLVFEETEDELGEHNHWVTYWAADKWEIDYYYECGGKTDG